MLRALFPPKEVRAQASTWGTWPGDAVPTWSGVDVTEDLALQLSTVFGCVRLIADGISTLPWDVFRRLPDGSMVEVVKPAWLEFPTVDLSFAEWCSQVLSSLLLHGNAYVIVTRNDRGVIVELVPLDPASVRVRRDAGVKSFVVNGRPFSGEMVHIKGTMLPGADVGMSPIECARQTIGLGLATLQYGGQFFDGEGNMPGVIEIPGSAQPETMKAMAEAWRRKRSRSGKGLPGVLEGGATWKSTAVTPEQAQFLATRKYTAAQIAGEIFLVDPSDLGIPVEGTSLTYANLEQRNARRVQVTFLPWIIRLEAALSALLLSQSLKFNVSGLLRGDVLARFQAYEIASSIGVLTTDEMRELENWPPLSDEDRQQSRTWQEVGLPALVSDGIMTLNEARAQLGLAPVSGGDVPRDPVAEAGGGTSNVDA